MPKLAGDARNRSECGKEISIKLNVGAIAKVVDAPPPGLPLCEFSAFPFGDRRGDIAGTFLRKSLRV